MFWTPNELSRLFTVDSDWLLPLSELAIGRNARTSAVSGQVTKSTSQRLSRPRPIWFKISVLECCPDSFFHFERRFSRRKFTFLSAGRNSAEISISNFSEFSDREWRPLKHIFRFEPEINLNLPHYWSFIVLLLKMANISAVWEKFRPSTVTTCIPLSFRGVWNTISVAVAQTDYTGV